jgi:hypothetical protein
MATPDKTRKKPTNAESGGIGEENMKAKQYISLFCVIIII